MMGPVVTRLFNAKPYKPKTVEEESEPFMFDPMIFPGPDTRDREGLVSTPMRRYGMRQRMPNPKRES